DDCDATHHSQGPDRVTCEGDPLFAPLVRIVANDKPRPEHHRAITWFDGMVELGSEFVIDAENAQRDRLKGTTWIHIIALNGEVLQSVSFHTSCSLPLKFGDQFGGVMLVGFEPEER
ncbi:MAG: hypothetical protein IH886_15490, partial [Nitrospinae bacterium]|nr:hypothetical protein [Nitrospinota bacterium]